MSASRIFKDANLPDNGSRDAPMGATNELGKKKKRQRGWKKAFAVFAAQPNKRSSSSRSEGEVDNSLRSHVVPDGRGSPFSCFVGGAQFGGDIHPPQGWQQSSDEARRQNGEKKIKIIQFIETDTVDSLNVWLFLFSLFFSANTVNTEISEHLQRVCLTFLPPSVFILPPLFFLI